MEHPPLSGLRNILENKKLMIMAGALTLLLVVLLTGVMMVSNRNAAIARQAAKQAAAEPTPTKPPVQGTSALSEPVSPPQVSFGGWIVAEPASVPTSLNNYPLKENYSDQEVSSLAQKLDAAGFIQKKGTITTAYTINEADRSASVLLFNAKTGEYSYKSTAGVPLPQADSLEDKSLAFLRTLGWNDPTLKVTATYQNKQKPELTYVEIHRDWTQVKGPILNSVGLLNLPETQRLATLSLNTLPSNALPDADIYNASDSHNGYVRADDFNTMTLAVNTSKQRVTMIRSNIRALAGQPTAQSLISFNEAVDRLRKSQYEFILTSPGGNGPAVDWKKMYPNNKALSNNAVVTDSTVGYLEQSPSVTQESLEPYYIFRGHADLNSGYRVTFTAAVRASSNGQPQAQFPFSLIKTVNATDSTQKQATFDAVTPVPTDPASESTTGLPVGVCKPANSELNPVYQAEGLTYGWANYTYWKGELRTTKSGYWYYVPGAGSTATVIESNLDSIIAALLSITDAKIRSERAKIEYDIAHPGSPAKNLAATTITPANDTTQKQGTFYKDVTPVPTVITSQVLTTIADTVGLCPVRLTGSSPTLFIYGSAGTQLEVQPTSHLTYSDPVIEHTWDVTLQQAGLTTNGVDRPYLYYEYDRVAFNHPHEGWLVSKDSLPTWAEQVSDQLKLTAQERERMLVEVRHALPERSSNTLFIGLINREEIDQKVPLTFSPSIDNLYRFHFYVGNANGKAPVKAPGLTPIARSGLTVVEFGSHSE